METIEIQKPGTWTDRSESILNLAKALCAAQAVIEGAKKGAVNPHLNKKYADLASVWAAVREPLTSNGLTVLQEPSSDGNKVRVTTTLIHQSGEFVRSVLEIIADRTNAQGVGSALTYARRYALSAVVGIAPEEDDGHAASNGVGDKKPTQQAPQRVVANLKSADQLQNEATKKAMGDDNIDMSKAQVRQKIFRYNLKSYLDEMSTSKANAVLRKLESKQGYEDGEGSWVVPEYIDGLKDYLSAEAA